MALTPVQNLKFASVKILQERIDQIEQQAKRAPTTTEQIFKAKKTGSSIKAEEKSTYDKIRSKIAGATVFDNSRMSKSEFKAKILKEIARSLGIDLDKDGTDLKHLANLVRDKLAYMKSQDPVGYEEFMEGITKRLGLDKLGLKAEDVVAAMADPSSQKAEEVDQKLDVYFGKDGKASSEVDSELDDIKKILNQNGDTSASEKAAEQLGNASSNASVPNGILTDQPTGTYMPKSFPPARR
ncbi:MULTISPECIES: hypothetical protein [Bartonella]|uniref:hypothetical protein n=1 Tax=Bartonella TaxID=773 RepID=UPI0018DB4074|nr:MULTISPECIES: hypothetical protein [Bartonella]MBH9976030.1 hypothetical protein [Bartonella choladocola]MBI0015629.1 hypothetical protein [Bartonella sp. B10834G3]MBI0141268.1 hypothetical protein [Bartonella choladocola]